jgi:hypothetical protein
MSSDKLLHKWDSKFKCLQHDIRLGYFRTRHGKIVRIDDTAGINLTKHYCKRLGLSPGEIMSIADKVESFPITKGRVPTLHDKLESNLRQILIQLQPKKIAIIGVSKEGYPLIPDQSRVGSRRRRAAYF